MSTLRRGSAIDPDFVRTARDSSLQSVCREGYPPWHNGRQEGNWVVGPSPKSFIDDRMVPVASFVTTSASASARPETTKLPFVGGHEPKQWCDTTANDRMREARIQLRSGTKSKSETVSLVFDKLYGREHAQDKQPKLRYVDSLAGPKASSRADIKRCRYATDTRSSHLDKQATEGSISHERSLHLESRKQSSDLTRPKQSLPSRTKTAGTSTPSRICGVRILSRDGAREAFVEIPEVWPRKDSTYCSRPKSKHVDESTRETNSKVLNDPSEHFASTPSPAVRARSCTRNSIQYSMSSAYSPDQSLSGSSQRTRPSLGKCSSRTTVSAWHVEDIEESEAKPKCKFNPLTTSNSLSRVRTSSSTKPKASFSPENENIQDEKSGPLFHLPRTASGTETCLGSSKAISGQMGYEERPTNSVHHKVSAPSMVQTSTASGSQSHRPLSSLPTVIPRGSETPEHTFTRMAAIAASSQKYDSSCQRRWQGPTTSRRRDRYERDHKPDAGSSTGRQDPRLFAGHGWISLHPLSSIEGGKVQSRVSVDVEDGSRTWKGTLSYEEWQRQRLQNSHNEASCTTPLKKVLHPGVLALEGSHMEEVRSQLASISLNDEKQGVRPAISLHKATPTTQRSNHNESVKHNGDTAIPPSTTERRNLFDNAHRTSPLADERHVLSKEASDKILNDAENRSTLCGIDVNRLASRQHGASQDNGSGVCLSSASLQSRETATPTPVVVPLSNGRYHLQMPWDHTETHPAAGECSRRYRLTTQMPKQNTTSSRSGSSMSWMKNLDHAERGHGKYMQ